MCMFKCCNRCNNNSIESYNSGEMSNRCCNNNGRNGCGCWNSRNSCSCCNRCNSNRNCCGGCSNNNRNYNNYEYDYSDYYNRRECGYANTDNGCNYSISNNCSNECCYVNPYTNVAFYNCESTFGGCACNY